MVPETRPDAPARVDLGSVAGAHRDALRGLPQALRIGASRVQPMAADRDAALAGVNAALREQGRIVARRDETYAVVECLGAPQRLCRRRRGPAA